MSPAHEHRGTGVVRSLAPFGALLVMAVLPFLLGTTLQVRPEVAAQHAAIKEAIEAAPWNIGRWRGQDSPVPAAAEDILKPNAILSRRYKESGTSREATLMVIHCSDARDMQGHYPRVCYPNAGWAFQQMEQRPLPVRLMGEGEAASAAWYRFSLAQERSGRELHVFSLFVLPDGQTASDHEEVVRLARRASLTADGVAQIQIVFDTPMSNTEREAVVRELLTGVLGIVRAFGLDLDEAS